MSEALWGFMGVLVGAAVAVGVAWWQFRSERNSRRRESEALAIDELQRDLAAWFGRLVKGSFRRTGNPDFIDLRLRLEYLVGSIRDEPLRSAVSDFLSKGGAFVQSLGDGGPVSEESFPESILADYEGVQSLLTKRWRDLT